MKQSNNRMKRRDSAFPWWSSLGQSRLLRMTKSRGSLTTTGLNGWVNCDVIILLHADYFTSRAKTKSTVYNCNYTWASSFHRRVPNILVVWETHYFQVVLAWRSVYRGASLQRVLEFRACCGQSISSSESKVAVKKKIKLKSKWTNERKGAADQLFQRGGGVAKVA